MIAKKQNVSVCASIKKKSYLDLQVKVNFDENYENAMDLIVLGKIIITVNAPQIKTIR